MNLSKKILDLIVILSTISVTIFAFSGGTGESSTPYQISTCANLQNISSNLTANYELVNDIVCTSFGNFKNIGYSSSVEGGSGLQLAFDGFLRGNNFTISDLSIVNLTNNDSSYMAIFAYINNTNLYDFTLDNVFVNENGSLSGNSFTSSLVGLSLNSNITNVHVINSNLYSNNGIGGLALFFSGSNSKIENSSFQGNIVSTNGSAGGLVGSIGNDALVKGSYSKIYLEGATVLGGLVAFNNGKIEDSYSRGEIIGQSSKIGGLVGSADTWDANDYINNSFAIVDISGGGARVGGIIGENFYNTIENSYSISNLTTGGGLVGYNYNAVITNSYWYNNSENINISIDLDNNAQSGNAFTYENISMFYNVSNEPMVSHNPNLWNFYTIDFQKLSWENDNIVGSSSLSSLFPFGGIYIYLILITAYFLF
jgi:hypothetical protein